ncbi:MAG: divalent-cation tolerance protein CutA [Pseudomonadota bacterium]
MTNLMIVLVTINDKKEAAQLAKKIVGKRLAACVNIIPDLHSIYEWDGGIQDEKELLLIMKTTPQNIAELKEFVEANHPYEVPEFVVLDAADVSENYLRWVQKNTLS